MINLNIKMTPDQSLEAQQQTDANIIIRLIMYNSTSTSNTLTPRKPFVLSCEYFFNRIIYDINQMKL